MYVCKKIYLSVIQYTKTNRVFFKDYWHFLWTTLYIHSLVVDVALNLNALPHKQQLLKDCAMNVIPLCSRFLFIERTATVPRTVAFARGRKRLRVTFIYMFRYSKKKEKIQN